MTTRSRRSLRPWVHGAALSAVVVGSLMPAPSATAAVTVDMVRAGALAPSSPLAPIGALLSVGIAVTLERRRR